MLVITTKLSWWIICYGYLQTGADIHMLIKNGHQWGFQPKRFTQHSALVTTVQNQSTLLLSLIKQKCCEQGHQMFKIDVCEDFPKLMFYNRMNITWPSWKEIIHESLSFHIFIVVTDPSSSLGNFRNFFLFHNKDTQYPFDLEKEETGIQRDWKKGRGGDWCLCHSVLCTYWSLGARDRIQSGKAVWQSSGFTSKE